MNAKELTGLPSAVPKTRNHLKRLAIEHVDALIHPVDQEDVFLRGVSRERDVPRGTAAKGFLLDELLLQELPLRRKHLNAIVDTIADVQHAIFRQLGAVYRVPELFQRRRRRIVASVVFIVWNVAVRAPEPFERARLRVEDDDAMVAVAVGNVGLFVALVDKDLRRLSEGELVGAARVGVSKSELFDELAFARELEQLAIVSAVTSDPHRAVGLNGDAVIAFGPFVAGAGSAP